MKLQRIETPNYIVWVSDEKPKEGDTCLDGLEIFTPYEVGDIAVDEFKKIIAYQPKGNTKELDLPLLPDETLKKVWKYTHDLSGVEVGMKLHCRNGEDYVVTYIDKDECGRLCYWEDNIEIIKQYTEPHNMLTKHPFVAFEYSYEIVVEDDVEKFVKLDVVLDLINDQNLHLLSGGSVLIKLQNITNNLHKAAIKTFSEENLKKAYNTNHYSQEEKEKYWEIFKQSLKQPKTPKWFVAEMKCGRCYVPLKDDDCWSAKECSRNPKDDLPLTTTINGKTYLVGTYIY
jgi:hypothetical protein